MKLKAIFMAFAIVALVVFYFVKGSFRLVRVIAGWTGDSQASTHTTTQRA